jgi:hypothetical protein
MMGGSGWCDFAAYARRSKGLEVLIPILYLKGVSTGDFEEALLALLGKDAGGLSASTVGRLKDAWSDEHARWSRRDLSAKRAPRGSTKRIGSFAAMQELARPEGVDVAGSKTTDFTLESVRALDSQAFSRWFFRRVSAAQNGGIAFLEFAGCKHWSSAAWPP